MNKRLALLSLLLLPLLACTRQEPAATDPATAPAADAPAAVDATTPAAADANPAAPAEPATADAAATETTAEAATAPVAAAPVADILPGPALVEGRDYVEIPNGQPFAPRDGKVEVVEVFGYVCPACAQFQTLIGPWKSKLPADVRFTYVPAMFGGTWDDYAHAFYAAESMGLVGKTHDALYKAIHIDQSLKGERGRDSIAAIANFYGDYGVDPKQFASTMASFAINAKTSKAKQFAMRNQVQGTPSLIVDGKYLVKGSSFENMLQIADQLIARERAAGH